MYSGLCRELIPRHVAGALKGQVRGLDVLACRSKDADPAGVVAVDDLLRGPQLFARPLHPPFKVTARHLVDAVVITC